MYVFILSSLMVIISLILAAQLLTVTSHWPMAALAITWSTKIRRFCAGNKDILWWKLKLFGSLRYDYNPYFDPKFTPRLAAVYSPNANHNFRFTFQNGYRFPSLFEALSYVNNGRVKRVGSLEFINEGLGYLNNSYTQQSVTAFNAAVKRSQHQAMMLRL